MGGGENKNTNQPASHKICITKVTAIAQNKDQDRNVEHFKLLQVQSKALMHHRITYQPANQTKKRKKKLRHKKVDSKTFKL